MAKYVVINRSDNVGIALEELKTGEPISILENMKRTIVIKNKVPFGHKFAIHNIKKGQSVLKYGEVIGRAKKKIMVGEHVHVHNVESNRGRGDEIDKN